MNGRLLRGDRPYWYIHESANFTKARGTYLTQTPVTCEAGPGSPSGHVMANVILFIVICDVADTYFIKSRFIIAAWFYPRIVNLYKGWPVSRKMRHARLGPTHHHHNHQHSNISAML